jgi:hypothetical protein
MGFLLGDVREDGRFQALLPQLLKDGGPEKRVIQRGRTQGDERRPSALPKRLLIGPGNPQRQQPQDAPRPLEAGERLPLALKDGEDGGVEGVGGFKEPLGPLHREPVRKLRPMGLGPGGIGPGDAPDLLSVTHVFKQPSADDFGNLHPLREEHRLAQPPQQFVQPLELGLVLLGHLVLGKGEGDDQDDARGTGYLPRQDVQETVELGTQAGIGVSRFPCPADETEHFVHQDEGRFAREDPLKDFPAGDDALLVVLPHQGEEVRTAQLPGQVPPGRPAAGLSLCPAADHEVKAVADENGHPGAGGLGQPRLAQKFPDARPGGRFAPGPDEVVEEGKEVGLAAAELGGQVDAGGCADEVAVQTAQRLRSHLAEGVGQVGAGEEAFRFHIIPGRPPVYYLVQVNGKLCGVQGNTPA